jgi:alkanesulfonate monooxygenase SsuD/methylene tetrahydromethanopterin reductase-like flavin-dependent oxidoreductase (luciferase family)
MVKVILQLYPMLRAEDESEREQLRPMGRNVERFQEFVAGLPTLCEAADDLGLWGMASIEHHFHSEGYEVGPNPGIIAAHLAAHTKTVRVGQLGFTMGAQNPIRVAEDAALLDHLTRGRCFVGFSRGYQARWTNVLGQHLGSRATLSPEGFDAVRRAMFTDEELAKQLADDRINRDVFEEQVDMVLDAWASDSLSYRSPRWEIPFPYNEGIEWGMADVTRRLGAPGEIGDDGRVRRVSVCPAPFTKPHPPVFLASAASQRTIEYAGDKGFVPTYFSPISRAGQYGEAYVEHAERAGRSFALGQNQALVRWAQIGETTEAARQAVMDYDVEIYKNLYQPLTPSMPFRPEDPVQSVLDSGLFCAGTVDEVRDQFVSQWAQLPAEYVVLIYHYSHMPTPAVIDNLEAFVTKVKPALDDLTSHYED